MSTIKVGTIEKASGDPVDLTKQEGVKAWANTNAAGTVINDSFNISSLIDAGIGIQTYNVTNAFLNAYYAPVSTPLGVNVTYHWVQTITTNSWEVRNYVAAYADVAVVSAASGDLA